MKVISLFKTTSNNWLTNQDIYNSLVDVEADKADILYIHTKLDFGIPNPELSKKELLNELYQVVIELKVPTICFPSYTFSFCNGLDYNVDKSKSKMGVLNEFVRKRNESVRSLDPLMSVVVVGEDKSIIENLSHDSIGTGSTFDKLHNKDNVKFLFLGARLGECFTYMHYIEEQEGVPYRYNRKFKGKIITSDKNYIDEYNLFVRYKGVVPGDGSYKYEDFMLNNNLLKKVDCGDSSITCVSEENAYNSYVKIIRDNPNFFLTEKFNAEKIDDTFEVENMVSL